MWAYGDSDIERYSYVDGASEPRIEYRDDFALDRDRLIYSTGLRRLAGKSQVVAVEESGLYHTRLTHSLKAAQLGRRWSERLRSAYLESCIETLPSTKQKRARLEAQNSSLPPNPDLVEAACLAHDIGHPPFGHAGEQALNDAVDNIALELMEAQAKEAGFKPDRDAQDLALAFGGGFEGNAQSFRILTRLSVRRANLPGLDLTRSTLDALKYPWPRTVGEKKWGYYPQDWEVMEWVRAERGIGRETDRSFEAQLVEWCDDVTYACHDLEDFYRSGFIPLERLFDYKKMKPKQKLQAEPDAAKEFFEHCEANLRDFARSRALGVWAEMENTFTVLTAPYRPGVKEKALVRELTTSLITWFMDGMSVGPGADSGGDVPAPGRYMGTLVIDADQRLACDMLKELLVYYVILRPPLATQQEGQRTVVAELVRRYFSGKDEMLPDDRQEHLRDGRNDPLWRLRIVSDHVSSLTEQHAMALHRRMTGVTSGSITDPMWIA